MNSAVVKEIQERIFENASEDFICRTVPELFFWWLGIEYIGSDTVTLEVCL